MLVVLGHDLLIKIRNIIRQLRAGKIQHERPLDDGHLDGSQIIVTENELRDVMARDLNDLSFRKQMVNVPFAFIPIQAIEEFNGRMFCRPPDRSILSNSRTQFVDTQPTVTSVEP